MKSQNQLIKPKIALTIFEKNGERYRYHPSIRRMRKMLNTSLKSRMKLCKYVSLKVTYGSKLSNFDKIEAFDNFIETSDFEELKKTFEDFTEE